MNKILKTNEEVIFENRGKIISQIYRDIITPNKLTFLFDDGNGMTIKDIRQYSSESRYMSCDVTLFDFWGARFLDVIDRDKCEFEFVSEDECHQTTSIEIVTTKGSFEITFHNRNDGQNNGFLILIEDVSESWFKGFGL